MPKAVHEHPLFFAFRRCHLIDRLNDHWAEKTGNKTSFAAGCGKELKASCEKAQQTWSLQERQFCCASLGLGCPDLKCQSGRDDWQHAWSPGKKIWCCKHYHVGCGPSEAHTRTRVENKDRKVPEAPPTVKVAVTKVVPGMQVLPASGEEPVRASLKPLSPHRIRRTAAVGASCGRLPWATTRLASVLPTLASEVPLPNRLLQGWTSDLQRDQQQCEQPVDGALNGLDIELGFQFYVTVVDCKEYFEYTPGVLRAFVRPAHLDSLTFTLQPVYERKMGVKFIWGEVKELNGARKTASVKTMFSNNIDESLAPQSR
eukprot:g19697.t1